MANITEKIAALLRLAGNNPNAHEAASALAKARALMAENGLAEADLLKDSGRQDDGTVADTLIDARVKAYPAWMGRLAMVVGKAFRCQTYIQYEYPKKEALYILGDAPDVDIARTTYIWSRMAAVNLGAAWAKELPTRPTDQQMDGYFLGFIDGIAKAFAEQDRQHPEWGLVLVQKNAVKRAVADKHLTHKTSRIRYDGTGQTRGYQDGYDTGRQRSVAK